MVVNNSKKLKTTSTYNWRQGKEITEYLYNQCYAASEKADMLLYGHGKIPMSYCCLKTAGYRSLQHGAVLFKKKKKIETYIPVSKYENVYEDLCQNCNRRHA